MKGNQNQKIKSASPEELTVAHQRIIFWFAAFPNVDFTFNEVCKATKTAKTTAKTIIEKLEKEQIIKKTVLGKLWRLVANLESAKFRQIKMVLNLDLLLATNTVEFILNSYPQARTIVLFGSFRKGEDLPSSDIDIAVEIPGLRQTIVEQMGTINQFGFRENVKVSVLKFSRESIDLNLFANIVNGIVLHGFLEAKP